MKKVLALVLAFTLVFSSISFVFADEEVAVSDEGAALVTLGMLSGADGGYTAEYEAEELTRLQAAAAILKLKGLYEDAIAFDGVDNFADVADYAWVEGRNLMAYMKANPELGFIGDGVNFNPGAKIDEQSYYKVLLETLGYKQNVGEVVGDFAWEETLEFAEKVGLKPAGAEKFTVADLAKATVAALKAETKDGKVYIDALIEAGKVTEEKAVVAGFKDEAPVLVEVAVKEVKALGNTVVQVEFKEAVGAEAENVGNYEIDGLKVEGASLAGEKLVRLETEAMKAGKLYVITIGEEKVKFAGVAKVSGSPELKDAVSEDVEEVVLTFDKELDLVAATDVDNYSIANVEVVEAEVKGKKVTLTTEGLKDGTSYTVKATSIKSIDGAVRKSTTKSFKVKVDKAPPRVDSVNSKEETNQRIILYFNEKVTKESAEDLANYEIKENKKDGDELEVLDVIWDEDDENNVEIVTEEQVHKTSYKLSVSNIADQRKVANVMTRPGTFTFTGLKEDTKAPDIKTVDVIAKDKLVVVFDEESRLDDESAKDLNNYTLTTSTGKEDLDIDDIEKLSSKKFLLTVEEMETDKYYKLKVVDVMDEFGNEMAEKSKSFKADFSKFASAELTGVAVTDKNTIVLTFSKDLDEKSAESIDNYTIDKNIGTPTKAEYDDDGAYTVTLKVNELVNGEKYKITIKGVKDLAGNILNVAAKDILATATKGLWDTDYPEIEDVYAANKYVVALEFSEKVKYTTGATVKLVDADGVVLTAFAYDNDDTIIEFSKYATDSEFTLDPTVTYSVYSIVYTTVKDLAGNPLKLGTEVFEFKGTDEVPDWAAFDTYEQINGGQFEIIMTKKVQLKTDVTKIVAANGGGTFDISVDKNKVKLTGTIEKDVEYVFNLNDALTDLHGLPVENDEYGDTETVIAGQGKTVLEGEETDTEKPYIVDIIALDRNTIEIEFSEHIKAAVVGNFSIKNLSKDKNNNIRINKVEKIDKEFVKISLTDALEGRYEYELTMNDKVVEDYAKNKADKDTFVFDGSDLAQYEKSFSN